MRRTISLALLTVLGACAASPPGLTGTPVPDDETLSRPYHHTQRLPKDDVQRQLDEIDTKVKALKDTLDHR